MLREFFQRTVLCFPVVTNVYSDPCHIKSVEKVFVGCDDSRGLFTKEAGSGKFWQPFSESESYNVLLACNFLLGSIDEEFPITALHFEFAKSEAST